jgi:hypothetical protein
MNFPPMFAINLDDRPDRWAQLQAELKGWPPIERVSAVKHSPGWVGCTLSHIQCLELAKERNYEWVLILEDDCMMRPNALQNFKGLLPFLWNNRNKWDVFMGGVSCGISTDDKLIGDQIFISRNPNLYKVSACNSHFCLLHRDAYTRILQTIPKNPSEYTQSKNSIDTWYRDNVRVWSTSPFIAIQREGFSDVINDYSDTRIQQDITEELLEKILPTFKFAWTKKRV